MGDFNIETFCKISTCRNFESLIFSADMKIIGSNCPIWDTGTTNTCIDHVIKTPRLINSNVLVEKCYFRYHCGILLVTGITIKITKSKRIYGVIKDLENPEIAFNVLLVAEHLLGKIDLTQQIWKRDMKSLRRFYWMS